MWNKGFWKDFCQVINFLLKDYKDYSVADQMKSSLSIFNSGCNVTFYLFLVPLISFVDSFSVISSLLYFVLVKIRQILKQTNEET